MMDKSLPAFRRFLRKNVIELQGNWANATHQQGSSSKQYTIGHLLSDDDSDDGREDADNEEGIAQGTWLQDDSQGAENVRGEENDIKDDYARLELIFPQLVMLITKGIADNSTINKPLVNTHISLFKPVTASRPMWASINAAYCRETTFAGAIIHHAHNPMDCGPVLQEQLTRLSFVSDGQIIEDLHHQFDIFRKCRGLDIASALEPNFALSVVHFKANVDPATRSETLHGTIRNFLAVVSVCPISIVTRLNLEIQGLDADDMDALADLVRSRNSLPTSPSLIPQPRPRYHTYRSDRSIS
jgi:folate-dependent phosphoribosylglycinamide formyltransferase PurN